MLEEKDGFIQDTETKECLHGIYPVIDCYLCSVGEKDKEEEKRQKEEEEKNKDKDGGKEDDKSD